MKISIILCCLIGLSEANEGLCTRQERIFSGGKFSYVYKSYCCSASMIFIDGKCTECPDGYRVSKNTSCIRCADNTYGKQCLNTCKCQQHERCDPVMGCTLIALDVSITLSPRYEHDEYTSLPTLDSKQDLRTQSNVTVFSDFGMNSWLIITSSIAGFFFFFTTCMCFVVCRWRKKYNMRLALNNAENAVSQIKSYVETEKTHEFVYDEIDETNMLQELNFEPASAEENRTSANKLKRTDPQQDGEYVNVKSPPISNDVVEKNKGYGNIVVGISPIGEGNTNHEYEKLKGFKFYKQLHQIHHIG